MLNSPQHIVSESFHYLLFKMTMPLLITSAVVFPFLKKRCKTTIQPKFKNLHILDETNRYLLGRTVCQMWSMLELQLDQKRNREKDSLFKQVNVDRGKLANLILKETDRSNLMIGRLLETLLKRRWNEVSNQITKRDAKLQQPFSSVFPDLNSFFLYLNWEHSGIKSITSFNKLPSNLIVDTKAKKKTNFSLFGRLTLAEDLSEFGNYQLKKVPEPIALR